MMQSDGSFNNKALLIHPTYFAPIAQYVHIIQAEHISFECCDNYQKQTYRNRCYIASSNGKQLLSIPVIHEKGKKQRSSQVKIDNKYDWQRLHLKAMETAYKSSPFFEFYIDDLMPVFDRAWTYLLDLNLFTHDCIMNALELHIPIVKTEHFVTDDSMTDKRSLVNAKREDPMGLKSYYQLFSDRHGFMENLSILDLLFMEGPNTLLYLEQQHTLI